MAALDPEDDYADMVYTPPLSSRSGSRMRRPKQPPQENLKQFWDQFNSKFPGKVYTVLPDNPYARAKAARVPKGIVKGQDAGKSYEQAKRECIRSVDRIARECKRLNQKYSDPHFDIEMDLKSGLRNCLDGLDERNDAMRPRGVKRVTEIFENPQFYVNGPTASDVRQGRDGDCWFMAALCTMGNKEGLIDKICVRRDEQVGVYGFVFYRDGEWQQCIVDDKLYLRAADYDESVDERPIWDDINRSDTEEEYRKVWQTGSRALYFAQCVDENETWLPLLEKAYAKAHGDYSAIEGGFVGEAIEDLTGGVTSDVLTSNILDKDRFWNEELMKVNDEFLFGCGTGLYSNWLSPKYRGPPRDRKGISENHSYSIMDAKEIDGVRLLKLRNPWGKKEWSGPWSDGSEQWTPQWMEKLNHKFGNDGFFWISYDDLLKKYQHFDRTRLFGPEWTITQQWTSLSVPWSADYHTTKFRLNVTKPGPVILVLSQLDTRYFKGLVGEYDFVLKFRLQKEGEDEYDYIVRSHNNSLISRSTNAEVNLDPGSYQVLMKIIAYRCPDTESTEDSVIRLAPTRREKLVQIGLSYDLAHAKGIVVESEAERQEREEREERRKAAERRKLREETKKRLQQEWIREQKLAARRARAEERHAAKAAKLQTHGRHPEPEPEPERVLPDSPVESPSDMNSDTNGHENAIGSKHPKNGSVPSIKFDDSHMAAHPTSRDTYSIRSSRRRSHSLRHSRRHTHNRDSELLEGFEFDSDIDMPQDVTPPRLSSLQTSFSDELDSKTTDPWNAVCVVGLRVYSKDEMLSLEVVRPIPEDETEAALDMDDPAVSATSEKGSRLWSMTFE
ncbi:calpain-like protein [Aspergillus lucknowensis]|uniref:Calpain catalytic domain-containing protein n=1 Tax=Aspergillus lucknowensis TaxID=176173 RepID=A0ABR4LQ56_9EURO